MASDSWLEDSMEEDIERFSRSTRATGFIRPRQQQGNNASFDLSLVKKQRSPGRHLHTATSWDETTTKKTKKAKSAVKTKNNRKVVYRLSSPTPRKPKRASSPFQFSSFPASLPRLHNTSSVSSLEDEPWTPRARLQFQEVDLEGDKIDLSRPYEQQRTHSYASSLSSVGKYLDETQTTATAGLSTAPESPHAEMQLHFQLVAQCSPIPGIPEEEDCVSPRNRLPRKPGFLPMRESHRRDRPMPDMDAFDSGNVSTRDTYPPLMCPPTPIRTPVSPTLISTKVLATCAPASLESSITTAEDEDAAGESQLKTEEDCFTRDEVVSMSGSFDVISTLGRGTFADVYKVRSKCGGRLFAVKRNRRQFRGRLERDASMKEFMSMQNLQSHDSKNSLYLLSFYQAWQEDGHICCQTELCCRDTCREMMDSVRIHWDTTTYPSLLKLPSPRTLPDEVLWKIGHDCAAGLSHMHSHGYVHNDIKPSNILFSKHDQFGVLCKIGDFGMARSVGSLEDGLEGDQKYMAPEVLGSGTAQPTIDVFSLGLTLYEMASNLHFAVAAEGPRWHDLRSQKHKIDVPTERSSELIDLIRASIQPDPSKRPTCERILSLERVAQAQTRRVPFLVDYIADVETLDARREPPNVYETPQNALRTLCSPPPSIAPPFPPEAPS